MKYTCSTAYPHICTPSHLTIPSTTSIQTPLATTLSLVTPTDTSNFSVSYNNVLSINSHYTSIVSFLDTEKPTVLFLAETLQKKHTNLHNRYIHHYIHPTPTTRGMSISILKSTPFILLEGPPSHNEYIAAEVHVNNTPITLLGVYVRPTSYLDSNLVHHFSQHPNLIILGDLNCKIDAFGGTHTDTYGDHILDLMTDYNLTCLNDGSPTYHNVAHNSDNCLDYILCSDQIHPFHPRFDNQWLALPSDHSTITCSLNLLHRKAPPRKYTYSWKHCDTPTFQDTLDNHLPPVPEIHTQEDIDQLCHNIINSYISATDETIPVKQMNRNQQWQLTPPIKSQIKAVRKKKTEMNKFKKIHKYTCPILQTEYTDLKEELKSLISHERDISWNNHIHTINTTKDMKCKHGIVKRLCGLLPATDNISTLRQGNHQAIHPSEQAQLFEDNLKETCTITYDDPATEEEVHRTIRQHTPSLHPLVHSSQTNQEPHAFTSEEEIQHLLSQTPRKAQGPDHISHNMLRHSTPKAASLITILFNFMFLFGYIPQILKTATTVMIYKGTPKPKSDPNSYRPISLLSHIGKMYDKLLSRNLHAHMNPAWSSCQSGYLPGRSTTDQLMRITQDAYSAIYSKSYSILVSLDCSKAFDRVWHAALLKKLLQYNIPANLLRNLASYLKDRYIQVRVQEFLSHGFTPEAGTPQGGVLSAILFIVYINSLQDVIQHSRLGQYADDISLWIVSTLRDLAANCRRLQEDINRTIQYLQRLKIQVNPTKTTAICFKHQAIHQPPIYLQVNNQPIPLSPTATILGFTFDQHIYTRKTHIQDCIRRSTARLNLLRRLMYRHRNQASPATFTKLYKSYIRPKLTYAAPLLTTMCTTRQKKLSTVQNHALRSALRVNTRCSNDRIHAATEIPTLAQHIEHLASNYTTKAATQGTLTPGHHHPNYLQQAATFNHQGRFIRGRRSRLINSHRSPLAYNLTLIQ